MLLSRKLRKMSQKQESRTASEFKGRTQIASGALPFAKGDVKTGSISAGKCNESDFLIENKLTTKDYYVLKKSIWGKIDKEAIQENLRTPMMQVDIREASIVILPRGVWDFSMSESYCDRVMWTDLSGNKEVRIKLSQVQNAQIAARMNSKIAILQIDLGGIKLIAMDKCFFLRYVLQ